MGGLWKLAEGSGSEPLGFSYGRVQDAVLYVQIGLELEQYYMFKAVWSPTGTHVAQSQEGHLHIIEVATGQGVVHLNGQVLCAAWSQSCTHVAVGSRDGYLRILD